MSACGRIFLAAALLVGCQPRAADGLSALTACAPAGWSAAHFPPGSADYGAGPGSELGRVRLIVPASVASRPSSGSTVFITDWWTVTGHDETTVTFADGRTARQYRSRETPPQQTTELVTPQGTWQLYAKSDAAYDGILRCIEPRLFG